MGLCIAVALVCMGYGIKVFLTGYGTAFFLIWEICGAGFWFLAWAIHISLWKKLPRWVRRGVIVITTCALAGFLWVQGCILSQIHAEGDPDLDYIIVLGALVYEDGPSSILRARLNSAYRYLEENPDTLCIVSGGQGYNEPFSEAEGMRRYLMEKGIDEERILMEDESKNTLENIRNSKAIIADEDAAVGIVTSNFHVYRACAIARKQGIDNVSGIAAYVVWAYMPNNMFREFFGIVKDTIKGNM